MSQGVFVCAQHSANLQLNLKCDLPDDVDLSQARDFNYILAENGAKKVTPDFVVAKPITANFLHGFQSDLSRRFFLLAFSLTIWWRMGSFAAVASLCI